MALHGKDSGVRQPRPMNNSSLTHPRRRIHQNWQLVQKETFHMKYQKAADQNGDSAIGGTEDKSRSLKQTCYVVQSRNSTNLDGFEPRTTAKLSKNPRYVTNDLEGDWIKEKSWRSKQTHEIALSGSCKGLNGFEPGTKRAAKPYKKARCLTDDFEGVATATDKTNKTVDPVPSSVATINHDSCVHWSKKSTLQSASGSLRHRSHNANFDQTFYAKGRPVDPSVTSWDGQVLIERSGLLPARTNRHVTFQASHCNSPISSNVYQPHSARGQYPFIPTDDGAQYNKFPCCEKELQETLPAGQASKFVSPVHRSCGARHVSNWYTVSQQTVKYSSDKHGALRKNAPQTLATDVCCNHGPDEYNNFVYKSPESSWQPIVHSDNLRARGQEQCIRIQEAAATFRDPVRSCHVTEPFNPRHDPEIEVNLTKRQRQDSDYEEERCNIKLHDRRADFASSKGRGQFGQQKHSTFVQADRGQVESHLSCPCCRVNSMKDTPYHEVYRPAVTEQPVPFDTEHVRQYQLVSEEQRVNQLSSNRKLFVADHARYHRVNSKNPSALQPGRQLETSVSDSLSMNSIPFENRPFYVSVDTVQKPDQLVSYVVNFEAILGERREREVERTSKINIKKRKAVKSSSKPNVCKSKDALDSVRLERVYYSSTTEGSTVNHTITKTEHCLPNNSKRARQTGITWQKNAITQVTAVQRNDN